MNKNIIYCTNIHSIRDLEHAVNNINHMNMLFNYPKIFMVSNGIEPIAPLGENVCYRKFQTCESYQLGPSNSVFNCLRMAAEQIENPEEYNVIYTHPDLYIRDMDVVNSLLDELEHYDFICRNYVGADWRGEDYKKLWAGKHYYMTEDTLISGRVLHRFKSLEHEYFKTEDIFLCGIHEISFADVIDNVLKLNVKKIDIEVNGELEINEMGFYHDHKH